MGRSQTYNTQPLPWWKDGLRFTCVRCGACCGGSPGTVRFTAQEKSAMMGLLGVKDSEFDILYCWGKYEVLSLREKPNYDCVFFKTGTEGAGCEIYEVRPAQCGAFPFWPDALESESSWNRFALGCPGMNTGITHNYKEISEILTAYIGIEDKYL